MTIGEGIFLGLFLLGLFGCAACMILYESKLQKELRDFRNSVKDSLSGIYKELAFSNYLNFVDCEENKNES